MTDKERLREMYYIIYFSNDEFLFGYNLTEKEVETTSLEIEARQFVDRPHASYVASMVGGKVKEIKYN